MLHGIIFDLDGTLADTRLDFDQIRLEAGIPESQPILEYCQSLSSQEEKQRVLTLVERHELQGALRATWLEDAESVLHQLHAMQVPMAIVTRNMRKAAQMTIEKLHIPIQLILTREDCKPKPDPDGLLQVAKKWQLKPNQLAYVGDYQFDLQAAKNAGMMGILKNTPGNTAFHHMADQVIQQFSELLTLLSHYESRTLNEMKSSS